MSSDYTLQNAGTHYAARTDEELLSMSGKGDTEAFAQIYDRYGSSLLAYATTLLKLPEVAEDVVHDTFIRLWEFREKIAIEKNFRGYIFRSCHNHAFNMNKKIARNQDLVTELMRYYEPHRDEEVELSREARDYVEVLNNALESLSPQRRRIWELCKVERKSYIEAGAELGISPNTVRNHLAKAMEVLRGNFREQNFTGLLIFIALEKLL